MTIDIQTMVPQILKISITSKCLSKVKMKVELPISTHSEKYKTG